MGVNEEANMAHQPPELFQPEFLLTVESQEGLTTIVVAGDFDYSSASKLQDSVTTVTEASKPNDILEMNLREVRFIDGFGLRALSFTLSKCEKAGVWFYIRDPSEATKHILEVAGDTERFKYVIGRKRV